MKAFAIAIGIALLVPASVVSAEEETPALGARVRLTSASPAGRLQGTVQAVDANTLTLFDGDRGMVQLSRAQLTKVEVWRGRKGNARKGLLIGALVGMAAGVAAMNSPCEGPGECWQFSAGENAAVALIGGAAFGVIGAGIGSLIKTDRWLEVPPGQFRVNLAPVSGRGIVLGITAGF